MKTVRNYKKSKRCKRCNKLLGTSALYKKTGHCVICYHKIDIEKDFREYQIKFNNLDKTFVAWLTGFYEGEGSLTTVNNRTVHNLRITQKEKKPLTYIIKHLKCGHLLLEQRASEYYIYRYNITKIGIISALLTVILPFMKSDLKIKKAKLFLKKFYKYYERS